jgi:hypothetical protein
MSKASGSGQGGIPPVGDSSSPPTFEESQKTAAFAPPPAFITQFACVTLNMNDRVRFINFPPAEVAAIQGIIQRSWPLGIKELRPYGQSQEFRLHGLPWAGRHHGDDKARELLLRILEGLYDRGWVLQAAIDISKKSLDKGNKNPTLLIWVK